MQRWRFFLRFIVVLISLTLIAACAGKKPNISIPTVIATLEKSYAPLETSIHTPPAAGTEQTMLLETETGNLQPNEPANNALTPSQTARPNTSPFATPTRNLPGSGDAYPVGSVPTVSFGQPTESSNPYPVGTPTLPSANPNLPAGLQTGSAVFSLSSDSATRENQFIDATQTDQSAVWTYNAAQLTLLSPTINCSGNSSSLTNSLTSGLNACLLAFDGSTLNVGGGRAFTYGLGSAGLYALGNATKIVADQVTITTAGENSRAVSAENGGSLQLSSVSLSTLAPFSPGVFVNLGTSAANLTDVTVTTLESSSPCLYTNATLNATNTTCTAERSETAVVENNGALTLQDSKLTAVSPGRWGALLYQSVSRDPRTAEAKFNMVGGSFTVTDINSPAFFVTNVIGVINLRGVQFRADSGIILRAGGQENWGAVGANGGSVTLVANNQVLEGDIVSDRISSVVIQLRGNSHLTGAVNPSDTSRSLALSLDATSTLTLTKNSYIPQISGVVLSDNHAINITGNNFNLYYDPALSSSLGGKTYQLTGGGSLLPHP